MYMAQFGVFSFLCLGQRNKREFIDVGEAQLEVKKQILSEKKLSSTEEWANYVRSSASYGQEWRFSSIIVVNIC